MASLFQGSPQTATSYTTSSTETPKWMQDAIYNQVQWATGVANTPYQPYELPRVAELSPLQQQAHQAVQNNQGFWQGGVDYAQDRTRDISTAFTNDQLRADQAVYLRPQLVDQNLNAGQALYDRAAGMSAYGAAQPFINRSADTTADALSERALAAAQPYLQAAGQNAYSNVNEYMNPFNDAVTARIAQLGARNLSENLLPAVSDSFIRAGQFGSGRMGEFGARALRDTQESILGQQAQALQQGYGQALSASQQDLARQAGLAGTVGSISGADLSRVLQGAGQYGQLGQLSGSLTGQDMSALTALGNARTTAGQAQQQFGLNAAVASQQALAGDYARQLGALQQLANMEQQEQQLRTADAAALDAAGAAQQGQQQRQLDSSYNQWQEELLYPRQQLDWLSTQIRGLAPITPTTTTNSGTTTGATYSPSPLSQLASGLYMTKGLTS